MKSGAISSVSTNQRRNSSSFPDDRLSNDVYAAAEPPISNSPATYPISKFVPQTPAGPMVMLTNVARILLRALSRTLYVCTFNPSTINLSGPLAEKMRGMLAPYRKPSGARS